ncbi:MAG: hypothetical protein QGI18_04965 [Candidatus Marinimicrobia bacterium]|jgi:hypothetical protein|nr:hypothetical protein [Candidatus Neomarinimicrobiota bacterium]
MFSYIAYFFTQYFEGYKDLIKSIDDWERSPILKGIAKFLATFKVIIDMLFSVGILFVLVFFLVDLIM